MKKILAICILIGLVSGLILEIYLNSLPESYVTTHSLPEAIRFYHQKPGIFLEIEEKEYREVVLKYYREFENERSPELVFEYSLGRVGKLVYELKSWEFQKENLILYFERDFEESISLSFMIAAIVTIVAVGCSLTIFEGS